MLITFIITLLIITFIVFYYIKSIKKKDLFQKDYKYDMIIVGGGVTGCSLAHSMASIGKKVLIVERDQKDVDRIMGEGIIFYKFSFTTWRCKSFKRIRFRRMFRKH